MSQQEGREVKPLRHEKATIRRILEGIGGTLTLTRGKLMWKRSRWALLVTGIREPPPELLEFDLRTANFALGPRRPAWLVVVLLPALGWLEELLTGGFRKTLKVDDGYDVYYFSVQDASSWLEDIGKLREATDPSSHS
jgi:hypothetical protein